GKPYQWGAEGPDSYDCSGLTMFAWRAGGVSLPHSSRAQFASLPHVPLSQLAPGDLVFSGNPIHHVAIYKGNGVVIQSPQTGEVVREESVWALNPVGAARP
ncbi:MAG: NlpC/P60 family protein, partial [Actinomycetota bacterium]